MYSPSISLSRLTSAARRSWLHVVAYRTGGAWMRYLPATLVVVLTLLAAGCEGARG